ncbi:MAG TPA: hypothetical protein VF624_06315 [Tepidisphaeraceae bacterium]|jgi:hypothetical protein
MGEVLIHFDPSRLSVGTQMRQVVLAADAPGAARVVIPIQLKLTEPLGPRPCQLSLQSLEYGRLSASAIATKPTTVILTVPQDDPATQATIKVSASSSTLKVEPVSDEIAAGEGANDRCLTYTVSWKTPPQAGEFRHVLRWTVTRPGTPPVTLELPLTGDAYDAAR